MSAQLEQVYPYQPPFNEGPLTLEERIKIISLMENPPEAVNVRRALHFYEVPKGLKYTFGDSEKAAAMLQHFSEPQAASELEWMLERVKGCKSLLEVGSNFGGTLRRMAAVMQQGSTIVSVDLPCDSTPKELQPLENLKLACKQISQLGGNVQLFIGDSHNAQVVEAVRKHGPYDFCFIDGDHSYQGMKADWENYGPMAKVVAFHDIGGPIDACRRFWRELKAEGKYRTEEFVANEQRFFGIGIVYREG